MIQQMKFVWLAIFATGTAAAQVGSQTLEVTDPAGVNVLRRLNERVEALSKQVMVCVEKRLAPPDKCFCNYPSEVAALQKEHQVVIRSYPSWSTRAVSWTDSASGSPVGHTIAIAHLGPQLAKCSNK
jgi:hypothetical protein